MFNIKSKPTFETTITLPVSGGEVPTFRAKYRALSDEEFKKYDRSKVDGVIAFLRDVVVGIEDLVGDDNAPVPYSEAVRDELLTQQYMRAALMGGYFDAITGFKAGN